MAFKDLNVPVLENKFIRGKRRQAGLFEDYVGINLIPLVEEAIKKNEAAKNVIDIEVVLESDEDDE